jgi:ABC-type transport system involved in multi-copper enzyme maturation permease subunit
VTWVTWRQHRLEGAWALAFGALLAAAIGFVAYELHAANCEGLLGGYCFGQDTGGQFALQLVRFNLYQYGLVVLPALAGAFVGCPLVAREIENGTHRLAWTQGVTRLRWINVKLVLVFVPLLVIAAAVGVLETILVSQQGPGANYWAYFDQQAPTTAAATLFALALGVVAGALIGRSIPAMAVTLIAFVVVRIGLAEIARPNYIPPLVYSTHDIPSFNPAGKPAAWWLDQPAYYDASGHLLGNGGPRGAGSAVSYVSQYFQPGDRFWTFQWIESAILVGLAAVLIGFAIYWVTRRVS